MSDGRTDNSRKSPRDDREVQSVPDSSAPETSAEGVRPSEPHPSLVSGSSAIADILTTIDLVAPSTASVLLTGESGTGKEIVANLVHLRGGKSQSPFVAINCAALPKDVIDNELFGHEREAFTGAITRQPGCFERANGGTLFLDEIAEMHPQVQAKLLRALESRTIRRLGGHDEIHVDVRVIAATNMRIPEALTSGALRADLYYRLSVVEIHIPPLRERKTDVPLLADHFLQLFCEKHKRPLKRFSPESHRILDAYDWPGNVREFRNMTESIVLLCPDEIVGPKHLPLKMRNALPAANAAQDPNVIVVPFGTTLAESERLLILHTLELTGNNKSKAASILGLSRKAMYEKLRRYELQKKGDKG